MCQNGLPVNETVIVQQDNRRQFDVIRNLPPDTKLFLEFRMCCCTVLQKIMPFNSTEYMKKLTSDANSGTGILTSIYSKIPLLWLEIHLECSIVRNFYRYHLGWFIPTNEASGYKKYKTTINIIASCNPVETEKIRLIMIGFLIFQVRLQNRGFEFCLDYQDHGKAWMTHEIFFFVPLMFRSIDR